MLELGIIKKLVEEEIIKKDDVVVAILTGRQKDPSICLKYNLDPRNRFANPPRSHS